LPSHFCRDCERDPLQLALELQEAGRESRSSHSKAKSVGNDDQLIHSAGRCDAICVTRISQTMEHYFGDTTAAKPERLSRCMTARYPPSIHLLQPLKRGLLKSSALRISSVQCSIGASPANAFTSFWLVRSGCFYPSTAVDGMGFRVRKGACRAACSFSDEPNSMSAIARKRSDVNELLRMAAMG
jgi:hypothetical protein